MILYLLLSLMVFAIGGVISYQVMKREIDFEQQRFLKARLDHAEKIIAYKKPTEPFVRDKLKITPLRKDVQETSIVYSDTVLMHAELERLEPHIKLDVIKNIAGRPYHITMYDLIIEADDIEEAMREVMFKMYIILFIMVLIISWIASNWLLKPFNLTLNKIKTFNLKDTKPLHFPATKTEEFHKLNEFLGDMTKKVRLDYKSLKEFTENASHEMQTPLSIASGKLDLLLESDNLKEDQVSLVVSAQESIKRISKMGKALALLTKIENSEFTDIQQVNLSENINKLLYDFKELIALKGIKLHQEIEDNVMINIDPVLAAILITNLLQNAVRHNFSNGVIWIILDQNQLVIKNTGDKLKTLPQKLFNRFRKDNQSKESLGLGLSIVKKICDANGFGITYVYENELHVISLKFNES